MYTLLKGVAAALLLSTSVASAATVAVSYATYGNSVSAVGSALAARDGFVGTGSLIEEDFESFLACPASGCAQGSIGTSVGVFSGYGASITNGGSQVEPKKKIVVRQSATNVFGRFNVTTGGSKWLDSNDREGILWNLTTSSTTYVSKLSFLLTDIDDVGNVKFQITVDGQYIDTTVAPRTGAANLQNGKLTLVTMLFNGPTSNVQIKMINGAGDGFGIDGIRLAAVPLPAGGILLLGALGGLALVRRRARAA